MKELRLLARQRTAVASLAQLTRRHQQRTLWNTAASVSTPASLFFALRKAAAREKARVRADLTAQRISKRREKEGLPATKPPLREPQFEGPNGERLTLAEQEKVLRRELASLSRQLEQLEKKEKADEATKELPPLDDQTLDQLYQALMMPPPASTEDSRLARLESGRKERALISSGVSVIEDERQQARLEAQQMLRERVLDARDRGRALLPLKPPTSSRRSPEADEDDGLVDLSRLTHEERQEARLQLLFERLTKLRSVNQLPDGKQQSLQDIKSGLASRIAKILEAHNYLLKPTSDGTKERSETSASTGGDQELSRIPEFDSIPLDRSIATDPAEGTSSAATQSEAVAEPQYISAANEILQDISSAKSRGLMLDRIERLLEQPANMSADTAASSTSDEPAPSGLPLGVASIDEWTALSVASARYGDDQGLARTLKLMRRAGYFPPPLSLLNQVMDVYASRGEIQRCQDTLSLIDKLGLRPDRHTFHCLTKAYLADGQYVQAVKILNSLEGGSGGLPPAAIATYTMAIDRMVGDPREEIQALGWNLFYHMRLVAHPIPDAPLYALMIRACAKGSIQPQDVDDPLRTPVGAGGVMPSRRSDAERALDLFREMTTRYVVRPNAEVYNNLILACARRKDFYLEAFRLLREMVELETERVKMLSGQADADAKEREGLESAYLRFAPDRYTFNALLQGCARNKDLPRARWVLAEMIRSTSPLFEEDGRGLHGLTKAQRLEMMAQRPNAETLTHVFWAYASFVPPVKRGQMVSKTQQQPGAVGEGASKQVEEEEDDAAKPTAAEADTSVAAKQGPASATSEAAGSTSLATAAPPAEEALTATEAAQVFSHLVPQTAYDLITEARALMARILADQPRTVDGRQVEGSLGSVTPSVALLNAYLAVLGHHLPSASRVETMWHHVRPGQDGVDPGLFAQLGLTPNANTLLLVLETATRQKPSDAADAIVEQVWAMFRSLESQPGELDPRVVEKCWAQRIRYSAKANRLDEAVEVLKEFARIYPPQGSYLAPHNRNRTSSPSAARAGAGVKLLKTSREVERRSKDPSRTTTPAKLAGELDLSPMPVAQKTLETLATDFAAANGRHSPDPARTSTTTTTSETPPPFLTFVDLELLHHRLVHFDHKKGLAYLGWVARAYEAGGRPRDDRK
ncbi:uncharacterized protein PSFLO_05340 [Pseudozyma flocculosa]|uniref:Pentacotripeptide-repeat region of PRORP domain-containing protein n=1 Tax=Pseudozyma flocculosa TaxID=84751 RepID=A0A5C3F921_9BASI|nr:uncharacterized protein PSFLO_05340 [Pseudozyma flocculosa]